MAGSHSTAEKHHVDQALLGGLQPATWGGGAKMDTDSQVGGEDGEAEVQQPNTPPGHVQN